MIGRLDDWVKAVCERDDIIVDPAAPNWAGIAVFKKAAAVYRERGYRCRPLAAAYRHHLHWSELIGGDVVLTMPYQWARRFDASTVEVRARFDDPVPAEYVAQLLDRVPDIPAGLGGRRTHARRVRHLWGDRADAAVLHRQLLVARRHRGRACCCRIRTSDRRADRIGPGSLLGSGAVQRRGAGSARVSAASSCRAERVGAGRLGQGAAKLRACSVPVTYACPGSSAGPRGLRPNGMGRILSGMPRETDCPEKEPSGRAHPRIDTSVPAQYPAHD